jgi:hypothetical protein
MTGRPLWLLSEMWTFCHKSPGHARPFFEGEHSMRVEVSRGRFVGGRNVKAPYV